MTVNDNGRRSEPILEQPREETPEETSPETPLPPQADQPAAEPDDILWRHLKTLPAFRALLRAVEARFYHQVELPEPLLDLGCGDGNFAELTFTGRQLGVGLDPWWNPLRKAKRAGIYALPLQGLGDQMPFPSSYFASAISNSVLEHIPAIQPVLNETSRVLKPGGRFVMTMPNHRFTERLGGAQFFERLGQNRLANRYRDFFNFISRHAHTESVEWWGEKLARAGFEIERWQYYFSEEALHALEIGHVQGVPSAVLHALTGQWVIAPNRISLSPTEGWVRPYFEEETPDDGTYLLIIARKVASHAIPVNIPAAEPFTQEQLASGEATVLTSGEEPDTAVYQPAAYEANEPDEEIVAAIAAEAQAAAAAQATPGQEDQPERRPLSPLGIALYLLGILVPAMLGQSLLNANPDMPGRGMIWYGFSLLVLLMFGWTQRDSVGGLNLPPLRLPRPGDLAGPVGFALGGLILSWLASSLTRTAGQEQPVFALLLWAIAIVVTLYGFWPFTERWPIRLSRPMWLTAGGLFLAALLVRYTNLTDHPFILSGTEANIGLEALLVNDGRWRNPFSTAWLTNPSLPLYLIALPIRFLGRTAFAVRFWSPLMGALTVAATYLLGRKLWNQYVGIAAALLLAGSHWHIHYSRLGLTNVWDPLFTLLALGLLAIAWQEQNRILWLLSGLFLGLNAYLYTSSHLLPLILGAFLLIQLLWNREALWANGRNLLMALTLALIIALPQLLYYNTNQTVFMERVNQYGIVQTGWLASQTAQTGQSGWQIIRDQLTRSALAFNAVADNSTYYGAAQPLLGYWFALALVLGIAIALYRGSEVKHQLLLIWLAVTVIFAGGLLLESPASHRLLIAAPAVALLAALAMSQLVAVITVAVRRYAAQAEGETAVDETAASDSDEDEEEIEEVEASSPAATFPRTRLYQLLAITLLALAMIVPDMLYYFVDYRIDTAFGDPNTEIAHELGTYMQEELDGSEQIYFLAPPVMYTGFPTITYLGDQFAENVNLFNVDPLPADNPAALLPPPNNNGRMIFVVIPSRFPDLAALTTTYPNGTQREFPGYYSNPLFITYEVRQ